MSRRLDFRCPECDALQLELFDIDWYGGNTEGMASASCPDCGENFGLEVFVEEPL